MENQKNNGFVVFADMYIQEILHRKSVQDVESLLKFLKKKAILAITVKNNK